MNDYKTKSIIIALIASLGFSIAGVKASLMTFSQTNTFNKIVMREKPIEYVKINPLSVGDEITDFSLLNITYNGAQVTSNVGDYLQINSSTATYSTDNYNKLSDNVIFNNYGSNSTYTETKDDNKYFITPSFEVVDNNIELIQKDNSGDYYTNYLMYEEKEEVLYTKYTFDVTGYTYTNWLKTNYTLDDPVEETDTQYTKGPYWNCTKYAENEVEVNTYTCNVRDETKHRMVAVCDGDPYYKKLCMSAKLVNPNKEYALEPLEENNRDFCSKCLVTKSQIVSTDKETGQEYANLVVNGEIVRFYLPKGNCIDYTKETHTEIVNGLCEVMELKYDLYQRKRTGYLYSEEPSSVEVTSSCDEYENETSKVVCQIYSPETYGISLLSETPTSLTTITVHSIAEYDNGVIYTLKFVNNKTGDVAYSFAPYIYKTYDEYYKATPVMFTLENEEFTTSQYSINNDDLMTNAVDHEIEEVQDVEQNKTFNMIELKSNPCGDEMACSIPFENEEGYQADIKVQIVVDDEWGGTAGEIKSVTPGVDTQINHNTTILITLYKGPEPLAEPAEDDENITIDDVVNEDVDNIIQDAVSTSNDEEQLSIVTIEETNEAE